MKQITFPLPFIANGLVAFQVSFDQWTLTDAKGNKHLIHLGLLSQCTKDNIQSHSVICLWFAIGIFYQKY